MATIIPQLRETAKKVFLAHVGLADPMAGYGATPWRQWLITGVSGVWFVVSKADPTATPKAYRCSLAQAKANLLAGY
jgi:hypothetical protein